MKIVEISENLEKILFYAKQVMIVSGAGLSVASGIPTFRGKGGIWEEDSENYVNTKFATFQFFRNHPEAVINWYRNRLEKMYDTIPSEGHNSCADLEKTLISYSKKTLHVTQNIDGLLSKAGVKQLAEIHGNINFVRCANLLGKHRGKIVPFKMNYVNISNEDMFCEECSSPLRPNVLWFDEYYDIEYYNIDLVDNFTRGLDLIIFVGTSISTSYPYQLLEYSLIHNISILEFNDVGMIEAPQLFAFKGDVNKTLPDFVNVWSRILKK